MIYFMKNVMMAFVFALTLGSCDSNAVKDESVINSHAPTPTENTGVDIKLSELATDKDLYCEMTVAEGAIADTANIDGKIYGFCSAMCKEEVVADPQKYLSKK
jgi:YHS domain-containing protein